MSVGVRRGVRVVDGRRLRFEGKEEKIGGGEKNKNETEGGEREMDRWGEIERKGATERDGGKKEVREWNGGTYSRRAVVIGGNFIILRHYPRYCNAIKLDTLRTPCGTGGISRRLLPFATLFFLLLSLREDAALMERSSLALLRLLALTASPRYTLTHPVHCPIRLRNPAGGVLPGRFSRGMYLARVSAKRGLVAAFDLPRRRGTASSPTRRAPD